MTNWYEIPGNDKDVVVSSRVRLARNFANYPFEPRMSEAQAKEICDKAKAIFGDGWTYTDFTALPPAEKRAWSEKFLVSPAFAEKKTLCAVLSKNSVTIMVNEEDHFRLQSIYPGLALEEAMQDVLAADQVLDQGAQIAYSEKLGYLTHCPTNLGTGMRASVMLFLPAYTAARGISNLSAQIAKIGLTIRGMYGEGTGAEGCLYQISNQVTLGITEEETVRKLETVVKQIVEKERKLRESQVKDEQSREILADKVSRTVGILLYARRMHSAELLQHYTTLRLGAALKLAHGVDVTTADKLLVESMPGNLTVSEGLDGSEHARDRARAEKIRKILSCVPEVSRENA